MQSFMDPLWWVSVVFIGIVVGIVVGIISGFLKDYISKILSRFSFRFKSWRKKRDAAHNRRVKYIAKEFGFIIDTRLHAIVYFIFFFGVFIMTFFASSTMYSWTMMMGIAKLINNVEIDDANQIANGLMLLGAILCLVLFFRGLYMWRLSDAARKIYEKNKFSGAKKRVARKKKR